MMKAISRKQAIRLINIISRKEFGWDTEELHQHLSDWGFGEEPHLSRMTALELHEVLRNLGRRYFVREPKYVIFLRMEAKRCGFDEKNMAKIIHTKFKVKSIYQLETKMVQGLTKAMKYYRIK